MDKRKGIDYLSILTDLEERRNEAIEGSSSFMCYSSNNYRYSSVLKGLDITSGEVEWQSSDYIIDMLAEYFMENSPVAPQTDNNWRITVSASDRPMSDINYG